MLPRGELQRDLLTVSGVRDLRRRRRVTDHGRAEVAILANGAALERNERKVARIERKAYETEEKVYTTASALNAHLAHAGLTSHRYPDGELCDLLAEWADSIDND